MSIDFVPGWLIVFPNIQKVKQKCTNLTLSLSMYATKVYVEEPFAFLISYRNIPEIRNDKFR